MKNANWIIVTMIAVMATTIALVSFVLRHHDADQPTCIVLDKDCLR